MKLNTLLLVTALGMAGTGVSLAANTGAVHDHAHEHATAPATLQLNAGQKWATDSALRQAMANIRQTMAASLHDIHEDRLSKKGYAALAKKVEGEVGSIVANCKLEPQADAQLHLIVAELLEGAEQMAGKAKQVKRQSGAIKVIGALEKYATYFDDAQFKAITH